MPSLNPPETRPPSTRPGGDAARDEFRCDEPAEVLMLMRELRDAGTPVALASPVGASIGATVWTVDAERRCMSFDVESGDPSLAPLVDGNEATAVAYLAAIKLQFDLHGLVLVRGTRSTALQAALPRRVYRFQRRAAYRVRTLDRDAPAAVMRHPAIPDMSLSLRVIDISIGGCALLLPEATPALPVGVTVHGVRLELDASTRLEVGLGLQHVSSLQGKAGGLRVGCEFVQIAGGDERVLQRFIDQTQKRRRLLSLD